MDSVEAPVRVACPNCGSLETGTFCSACGAELQAGPRHAYQIFLDSFLKFGEFKAYLHRYVTLLRSPTRNTIRAFEEGHLRGAIRFLEWSLVLFAVLEVSNAIVVDTLPWLSGFVDILTTMVTWSVAFWLYYTIMRKRGAKERSFEAFLIMSCLVLGVNLPIISAAQWLQTLWPIGGTFLLLLILLLIYIYILRVWKYFWELPGRRIIGPLILTSIAGGLAGFLFVFLVFSWFPGARYGPLVFDKPLSVSLDPAYATPFQPVEIDRLVPYTHPAGVISMEVPEDWTVTENTADNEYSAEWLDATQNGLVHVTLIRDLATQPLDTWVAAVQQHLQTLNVLMVVGEPTPPREGLVFIPLSYSIIATDWRGKPTTFPMDGEAFVERRGPFILVFWTIVPEVQRDDLTPRFTRVRNSITVIVPPNLPW